jgi:hypothetical protein
MFAGRITKAKASARSVGLVVQPKLALGPVNDPYEREADRVADQAIAQSRAAGTAPPIQPLSSSSAPEALGDSASTAVENALSGPGNALSPALQRDMGQRFGFDFSRVRIYPDGEAGRSARDINALAYTAGHRVVFAPGQFAPTTTQGLRLLSHELAHVVQQAGGSEVAGLRAQTRNVVQRQKAPDIDLARKLGTELKAGKRDDVLAAIQGMPAGDLNGLELAVTEAFATDKELGNDLRRIIRFVRHPPHVDKGEPFTASGGTATKKVPDTVGKGTVEAQTGVTIKTSDPAVGSSGGAFTLSYGGDDADRMHWMQFSWREISPEFPAKSGKPSKPMEGRTDHEGRAYAYTTDEGKPSWFADSGTQPGSKTGTPFYEPNTTVNRSPKELTMTDFPSNMDYKILPLFKDPASAPTRVVSKFHAETYLIRNMDVVYRAKTDIEWDFTRTDSSKDPSVAMTKMTVTGGKADHIEAAQRAALVETDPKVDFLAGPKPDELGEFTPITDLTPATNPTPTKSLDDKQWAAANDVDRLKDILNVSRSNWINETAGADSDSVHAMSNENDVQPGLNFWAKLGEAGRTVFIANGKNHGPELPLDKTGPLPNIGVILGPHALDSGKAAALETLRHEERHATHFQLATGWLLKWRDDGAKKPFPDWLSEQHAKRKISELDLELVKTFIPTGTDPATGKPKFDQKDTEVLAHAEGVMAGLQFLPPKPDVALFKAPNLPAPIDQLHLMRPSFDVADTDAKTLALDRLHDFCCETLSSAQRTSFLDWLKFLLDVTGKKAPSADEKPIQIEFTGHESFLKQVLTAVQKPCKK